MKINITLTKYVTTVKEAEELYRQVFHRLEGIELLHINAISSHNHRNPEKLSTGEIADRLLTGPPPKPEKMWDDYIKP